MSMFSNNFQYEVEKGFIFIPPDSPGDKVLISSKTYAGRELISILGVMVASNHFLNND